MEQAEFSERLAKLRMAKGVSAREMSLDLGQSANYINKIENNHAFPSMSAFFSICEYLGVSEQEFFNKLDNTSKQKGYDELEPLHEDTERLARGLGRAEKLAQELFNKYLNNVTIPHTLELCHMATKLDMPEHELCRERETVSKQRHKCSDYLQLLCWAIGNLGEKSAQISRIDAIFLNANQEFSHSNLKTLRSMLSKNSATSGAYYTSQIRFRTRKRSRV